MNEKMCLMMAETRKLGLCSKSGANPPTERDRRQQIFIFEN